MWSINVSWTLLSQHKFGSTAMETIFGMFKQTCSGYSTGYSFSLNSLVTKCWWNTCMFSPSMLSVILNGNTVNIWLTYVAWYSISVSISAILYRDGLLSLENCDLDSLVLSSVDAESGSTASWLCFNRGGHSETPAAHGVWLRRNTDVISVCQWWSVCSLLLLCRGRNTEPAFYCVVSFLERNCVQIITIFTQQLCVVNVRKLNGHCRV